MAGLEKHIDWKTLAMILVSIAGVLITIVAVSAQDRIERLEHSMVSDKVLVLTLEPMRQDIHYIKQALEKQELVNQQIASEYREINHYMKSQRGKGDNHPTRTHTQ